MYIYIYIYVYPAAHSAVWLGERAARESGRRTNTRDFDAARGLSWKFPRLRACCHRVISVKQAL